MIYGYDAKSCNALQRPFYRPVEAALRWCGLIAHETEIHDALHGGVNLPRVGQFPQWPCLRANTEKILDAIAHGEIPHGRDGKTVDLNEQVRADKVTVRHTDLREWMVRHHPGSKPAFLFDEIERSAHAAINADSFRALQADRDAARTELEQARKCGNAIVAERDALLGERDSLRAMVNKMAAPGERAEATYLTIIGALLELVRTPRPGRDSDAAVIRELIHNYDDKPGISKSTLEAKFADARRQLSST